MESSPVFVIETKRFCNICRKIRRETKFSWWINPFDCWKLWKKNNYCYLTFKKKSFFLILCYFFPSKHKKHKSVKTDREQSGQNKKKVTNIYLYAIATFYFDLWIFILWEVIKRNKRKKKEREKISQITQNPVCFKFRS